MKTIFNLLIVLGISTVLNAQSMFNTRHNLSIYGTGTVKATEETEICIFCHTPHNSKPVSPLWNRNDPGSTFTLYNSSTMVASPGQPTGASLMCLSCHDGTIALGSVINKASIITFANTVNMPIGSSNLSTDLRNDHPISFVYDAGLATANGQLKNPGSIGPQVKLKNNQLQCTSCHDAHTNIYTDFLVATTENSNLCNACHQKTYWTTSSHNTSVKTWNSTAPNPWPYTPWTTVAQNACENCHNPHNSGGLKRLLKYQTEEDNCFDCHNGNVASKNVQAEFAKTYRHNVYGYTGTHDPTEDGIPTTKHVECADCHNAHAAKSQTASAPSVKGANLGVVGINQSGTVVNPATNEYEICYRCHSGNAVTGAATTRKIIQNDLRLEFDPGNPSFHPIAAVGQNSNVPSLINPLTTSSMIYCTSCHASNEPSAPAGPHGSIYPQILKLEYQKGSTTESAAAYALCYSCHSRTSILADVSFKEHDVHVRGADIPCNDCHSPHGISSTQGNSTNNSNLINFNTAVVSNSSGGQLKFEDQGLYSGRCYLTCHGQDHNPLSY